MNIEQIIFDYQMTEDESLSFRVAYMFFAYSRKVLPNYHVKFPFNKDPRESLLFKYCFKLIQETKDKLKPTDYNLYVRAQIDVIKNVMDSVGKETFIEPQCLVGEKAWKRYLFYKKHYLLKLSLRTAKDIGIDINNYLLIKSNLLATKDFLVKKVPELNLININHLIKNKSMHRWYALGLVCGYYMALSPLVRKSEHQIDTTLYQDGLTDEVKKLFREEFSYEYNDS